MRISVKETSMVTFDGMVLSNHTFDIPLNHDQPEGEKISVFGREVVSEEKKGEELPYLVYLQGGPGFQSPRPLGNSGWIKRALQEYRVFLLDQRGTGSSTQVGRPFLSQYSSPRERADVLKFFRADSIVRDAEWIRKKLVGPDTPWSVLGQSFGGFCAVHYLSAAPEGLREVFITGGLPSLTRPIDEVYRETYKIVREKNNLFYERYPEDRNRIEEVIRYISGNEVFVPRGDRLTPRRFQQIGMALGASDGYEVLHYALEGAFVSGGHLSETFLNQIDQLYPFQTNPLYALLHEPCYLQATSSRWSAQRIREEFPDFKEGSSWLTGEMVYPWMFEEYGVLKEMKEEAELLAQFEDWPELYNLDTLKKNQVPTAAAVYANDMYVPRSFSEETASLIPGVKTWVTPDFEHNGLRADGDKVLGTLIDLVREKPE